MNIEHTLRAPESILEILKEDIPKTEKSFNVKIEIKPNALLIMGARAEDAGKALDKKRQTLMKTGKGSATPRTEGQALYYDTMRNNTLCFGEGPAGTGKTRMAIDWLVECLQNGEVDKLILSRPAVEAGERLGFLPGTQDEKVAPYMQPLYDSLGYHYKGKILETMLAEKTIEIAPIAFLRGRTLAKAGIVIDEAQNLTEMQMKMVLTRLGEGSKMIITGDCGQIDLPRGVPSGLTEALRRLANIKGIGIVNLTKKDVVRHPLVAAILEAYED